MTFRSIQSGSYRTFARAYKKWWPEPRQQSFDDIFKQELQFGRLKGEEREAARSEADAMEKKQQPLVKLALEKAEQDLQVCLLSARFSTSGIR